MIFVVVGPGRCGSSLIAKRLHDEGVFMGYNFREADSQNPEGYWEDLDFKNTNQRFLQGDISHAVWRKVINNIIKHRVFLDRPWGFKDPRTADLIDDYLELLPHSLFIRSKRPIKDVAASMVRCYGWTEDEAYSLAERREKNLDTFLVGQDVKYEYATGETEAWLN